MKRTFCDRCCFWSDTQAKHEHGTMFAICLNPNSAKGGTYTGEGEGCGKYMQGEPIDSLNARKVAT